MPSSSITFDSSGRMLVDGQFESRDPVLDLGTATATLVHYPGFYYVG